MNFMEFWDNLETMEKSIAITSPVVTQVKRAYWGAPMGELNDLPCVINAMAEPDRALGFGTRDQRLRVNVQLIVAKATVEDQRSSLIATAFWFAAKDVFDSDLTIGDTVSLSTFNGANPTVPVILAHGGQRYIGFSAILEIQDAENFSFG